MDGGSPDPRTPDRKPPRTASLIRGVQAGDQEAFGQLYDRHREPVLRSIALRLGCRLRHLICPDDVLQDAFLKAWEWLQDQDAERFRTPGTFRHVVVRIAMNQLGDAARAAGSEKRDHRRTRSLDDVDLGVASREPTPSGAARAVEIGDVQEAALLQLPEKYRTIVDCRDNLGMGYDEAAEALGIRRENAKLRYSRAVHKWNQLTQVMLSSYENEPK